jgi:hypothetical protein
MKLMNSPAIVAVFLTVMQSQSNAFVPSTKTLAYQTTSSMIGSPSVGTMSTSSYAPTFDQNSRRRQIFQNTNTALQMAAEDFDETKYTEAAWSLITALTKAADYYQAENVDAPFLLELMLNPSTHNAGDNAEAARKVVEKILTKSGTDIKALKSELETYFSKQAKLSTESKNKVMGRTLQKVLDAARVGKNVLGVSAP